MALCSPWRTVGNTNRTQLRVWDAGRAVVVHDDASALVYGARFERDGAVLLVAADRRGLTGVRLADGALLGAALPHVGGLDGAATDTTTGRWWVPGAKKGVLLEVASEGGPPVEHALKLKVPLAAVAMGGGALIVLDRASVLRRVSPEKPAAAAWTLDLAARYPTLGRIAVPPLLCTDDGARVVVRGGSDEAHPWGVDFVVDAASGEIVAVLERFQGRGLFTSARGGRALLTAAGGVVEVG